MTIPRTASLDEVLMILNDHLGALTRVEVSVFEHGSAPEGQVVIIGALEHWSEDEEAVQDGKEVEAMINERLNANVNMMERWRATYRVGTSVLDLWSLPARWLITRSDSRGYDIQVWLHEHIVSLSIKSEDEDV